VNDDGKHESKKQKAGRSLRGLAEHEKSDSIRPNQTKRKDVMANGKSQMAHETWASAYF
jgi:hypothetical protein